jgi:shikimate dehydrogenase
VVGRDLDKLAHFQASWKNSSLTVDVRVCGWEQLEQLLPQANLVVNCTPIGMAPQQTSSPLSAAQITKLPLSVIVYDLIYTPRPTQLLKMASDHGCEAIDGLEMLIYQGAAALKIWIGQDAPVDIMRQALINYARL